MSERITFAIPQIRGKPLLESRRATLAERAKAFEPIREILRRKYPHDPSRQEQEASVTEEGRALLDAQQEYTEVVAQVETWGDETPLETPASSAPQGWTCGHSEEKLDRQCKSCGYHYCADCQPESGPGARCKRCSGPIWLDSEPAPPERRNPAMRDY